MTSTTSSDEFRTLGLGDRLIDNLGRSRIRRPRDVQAQVIPAVLEGRDVLAIAATGSGKTLAWAAPVAQALLDDKPAKGQRLSPHQRLRCIVVVPTRELAEQIGGVVKDLIRDCVLRSTAVWGKVSLGPQRDAITPGVDVLVGTPGRLRELIEADVIDPASVKTLVVDEADRLLDMGFRPQLLWLTKRLPRCEQRILATATMPKDVEALAGELLKAPIRLEVHPNTVAVDHVQQHVVMAHPRDRVNLLLHLMHSGTLKRAIVFCRTRRRTGWVATALRRNGITVGQLHGDRSQAQRRRALAAFANGDLDVLVATDVASRGLHIEGARHVVNYDLPNSSEDLVHRAGRAAHGVKQRGSAWTFIWAQEQGEWKTMARAAGVKAKPETVPGFVPEAASERKKDRKPDGKVGQRRSGKPRGDGGEREPGWLRDAMYGKRSGGKKRVGPGRRRAASRPIKPKDKPGRGIVRPDE
ncbi:MAG: DEAD/DEAH box helicase [Phycisphaerales bacterium]|nr:DEAD/DEAH box helicase [Phycisphaerales bacterium]